MNKFERVVKKNLLVSNTDGNGNASFHALAGSDAKKIQSILTGCKINYYHENYWDELFTEEEFCNEDIEEGEKAEITRIVIKIEDLKNDFPSYYSSLQERNDMNYRLKKFLTERNMLDICVWNF